MRTSRPRRAVARVLATTESGQPLEVVVHDRITDSGELETVTVQRADNGGVRIVLALGAYVLRCELDVPEASSLARVLAERPDANPFAVVERPNERVSVKWSGMRDRELRIRVRGKFTGEAIKTGKGGTLFEDDREIGVWMSSAGASLLVKTLGQISPL